MINSWSKGLIFFGGRRVKRNLAFPIWFFACTILAPLLTLPPFAVASSKSESELKKDQIEKLEEDLTREREQFLKFHEKEKDLLGQLTELEKEIGRKKTSLKEMQEKIKTNKKALKDGQAGLKEVEDTLKEIEDRIGARLDAFYRYARIGYIRLLATSTELGQLRKRIKYLHIILEGDRRLLQEIDDAQQRQKKEVSLLKVRLAEIESMERAESGHMLSLKGGLDRRVILLAKIHQEREFYETAVKELEVAALNLNDKLLNLEKGGENERSLPTGFEKSKGKLPLPLAGKIQREGSDLPSVQKDVYRGVYIEGPSGTQVRAVFPGRVDYSGRVRGYGEIIIINHGSRFFTVSANLARREREYGDMIKTGEVIGWLAQVDASAEARLYFEIRKGGEILDPMKWLKVR
ncbi:MAG: peptidoglycan DD-metalloendopeptidase family protein [Proteobacteria bacterium]|nr:peptidoglycan DD-metalloendopeptidase family protein [Pseudomonadota bacterium]